MHKARIFPLGHCAVTRTSAHGTQQQQHHRHGSPSLRSPCMAFRAAPAACMLYASVQHARPQALPRRRGPHNTTRASPATSSSPPHSPGSLSCRASASGVAPDLNTAVAALGLGSAATEPWGPPTSLASLTVSSFWVGKGSRLHETTSRILSRGVCRGAAPWRSCT
jgi:hypothetical protein